MSIMRGKLTYTRILFLSVIGILLVSGCDQGISKAERLEMFIQTMESGPSPNPRPHFAGHYNVDSVESTVFTNTDMDPGDGLDITGYSISGDTFSMTFTVSTPGAGTVASGTFHVEDGAMGSEEWFIKQMTVPIEVGTDTVKIPLD